MNDKDPVPSDVATRLNEASQKVDAMEKKMANLEPVKPLARRPRHDVWRHSSEQQNNYVFRR